MADLLTTIIATLVLGSLYALIALGYTMVFGVLKLINFAHSDVVALGAWSGLTAAVVLLPNLGLDPAAAPWWGSLIVVLVALGVCGLVGFCVERFAYRPIRRAPRLNALITAIGVSLLLQNFGQLQYTLVDNESIALAGARVDRAAAATRIVLDGPLTIEPGYRYEISLYRWLRDGSATPPAVRPEPAPATQPAGGDVIAVRRIVASPGVYAAGAEVEVDSAIGRQQVRQSAAYQVRRISDKPAVRLPFGTRPASMPPGIAPRDDGRTVAVERRAHVERHFAEWAPSPAVLLQLNFFEPGPVRDGQVGRIYKPVKLTTIDAVIVVLAVLLMFCLQLVIFRTRTGTAMRAVSYNLDTAALMGIPVDRVISITFVAGTMLAAAAGFLYALRFAPIFQTADSSWVLLGLKAFVAAVVGGIGNIRGAAVGGFLIAFVEQFAAFGGQLAGVPFISAVTDVFVFGLLILVLLVRPTGIFGSTVREKV